MQKLSKLLLLLCANVGLAVTAPAYAAWPERPVRVVVPFAPGAFTDVAARSFGAELSTALGQQFVVDNRTGAGGTIGTDIVAKAGADGYTLLVSDNALSITPALYAKLPYDAMRDLAYITKLAESPSILTAALKLPVKTVKDVIDLARAQPGELTFGSGGQGSAAHLAMELLLNIAKVRLTHVPFKGVALSLAAVAGGQLDLSFGSLAAGQPHVTAGRLQGIALSGNTRSNVLPNVPTFAEAGYPTYGFIHWWSMAAPAGTPRAVIDRLQKELAVAAESARLKTAFQAQGARPTITNPATMTKMIDTEIAQWRDIIRGAGIKVE